MDQYPVGLDWNPDGFRLVFGVLKNSATNNFANHRVIRAIRGKFLQPSVF